VARYRDDDAWAGEGGLLLTFAEALTPVGGSDPSTSPPRVPTGVKSRGDGFGFFAPKLADASPAMIG
jgi:hypothetical protein